MEYTELIGKRESLRNYDPDRPVPEAVLQRILDAGRIAPSAHNNQPWKFIIVSSQLLLSKVKMCYQREWIRDAPLILILAGLRNEAWIRDYDGYNSVETDAAIALTHIILAAANEGVGTCWIMAYNPFALREVLNLDDNYQIFGITPLGYPKHGYLRTAVKKRKPLEEIVEFL
jgi:nitroreductase